MLPIVPFSITLPFFLFILCQGNIMPTRTNPPHIPHTTYYITMHDEMHMWKHFLGTFFFGGKILLPES